MNDSLHDALVRAATAGALPTLDDLGIDPAAGQQQVAALARAPIAPLAAEALGRSLARSTGWAATVAAFATELPAQRSLLALQESIDVLLDDPASAAAGAGPLHDALLADVHAAAATEPYLCAARIEGALRVALAGTSAPYLVLHHLAHIPAGAAAPYREALPRLIGIALDRWDGDAGLRAPLLAALHDLRTDQDAAGAAAFELASDRMRSALRRDEAQAAAPELDDAAAAFTEAAQLDEARDDALIYAAVCSAVAAFGRGDLATVTSAADALADVVERWASWHRHMYQPRWRQPTLDAPFEWFALVLDLRHAADRLSEPSWLDATAAVGQLARAYAADRTTVPVPGLGAVVRPAIDNPVAASAVLADQLARAVEADRRHETPVLPDSADVLLHAVRERRAGREHRTPGAQTTPDSEEADRTTDLASRLQTVAPLLLALPPSVAQAIAATATDTELRELNDLLALAALSDGISDHPVLARMRRNVVEALDGQEPALEGTARAALLTLLGQTLTFVHNRYEHGGPVLPGRPNILRQLRSDEPRPHERELQEEFFIWLSCSPAFAGRADVERSNIATGRADVIVQIGTVRLVTEVKRELDDARRDSLNRHIPQAAAYSGSNIPVSQLLILDLTEHLSGVPPLPDLLWVEHHRTREEDSPLHVIAAVVPGNRPTPSQLMPAPSDPAPTAS